MRSSRPGWLCWVGLCVGNDDFLVAQLRRGDVGPRDLQMEQNQNQAGGHNSPSPRAAKCTHSVCSTAAGVRFVYFAYSTVTCFTKGSVITFVAICVQRLRVRAPHVCLCRGRHQSDSYRPLSSCRRAGWVHCAMDSLTRGRARERADLWAWPAEGRKAYALSSLISALSLAVRCRGKFTSRHALANSSSKYDSGEPLGASRIFLKDPIFMSLANTGQEGQLCRATERPTVRPSSAAIGQENANLRSHDANCGE